jgi:PadR family transcriptional regulator, regulatory protein PadR
MTKKSEYRDLFPGALDLLILRTLNGTRRTGMPLPSTSSRSLTNSSRSRKACCIRLCGEWNTQDWLAAVRDERFVSAQNRPVRIFKLTEEGRKRLEEERSSFEKVFTGINRVLTVAES